MPLVDQIQGQLLSDLFNSLMSALCAERLRADQPFYNPHHNPDHTGTSGRPRPAAGIAAFACRKDVSATRAA